VVFESRYRVGGVVNICDQDFGSLGTSGFGLRYVEESIFNTGYGSFIMNYG
jgi:hypothetical protein